MRVRFLLGAPFRKMLLERGVFLCTQKIWDVNGASRGIKVFDRGAGVEKRRVFFAEVKSLFPL